MTPKQEALAFRIWAYCQKRRWDVGVVDLSETFNQDRMTITRLLQAKGWLSRLRTHGESMRSAMEKGIAWRGHPEQPVDRYMASNHFDFDAQ